MKIAIIGSAKSLFDIPSGEEIDSHDLIIRCNWGIFYLDKFKTGIYTDFWSYGFNKQMKKKINDIDFLCGILIMAVPQFGGYKEIFCMLKDKTDNLKLIEEADYRKSSNSFGEKVPTTGFNTVKMLLKMFPNEMLNLYGFSKNNSDDYNVFTNLQTYHPWHDLEKERFFYQNHERINLK